MNIRHLVLAVAVVIGLPVAAHAQESGSTVTRAQVRAELVQLENVGYTPGRANNPHYPADIQAAELAVASQRDAGLNIASMGGVRSTSSESGIRATAQVPVNSLYVHH
ncbi:MAG TPA: DUF4148 domain-containing protein [Paraburkholderia sp.]|jgi:hypothetical protein